MSPTRRGVLAGALALAACDRAPAAAVAGPDLAPLRASAPFPVGVSGMTAQLDDPAWAGLVTRHFGRLTPEWEMKLEAFLPGDDDRLDFSRADRLVAWAEARGLAVFGHTLVWYAQTAPRFEQLDGAGARFERAYADYVTAIARRYRGRVVGWDVVNEPIRDDGEGLRESLWSRNLRPVEHIRLAFDLARAADPDAVLFLNDYNLETSPAKRRAFLRLAETLLAAGAPLGGLGTQTHVDCALPAGAIRAAVADLAALGLPVHVSEIDVSTDRGDPARQPAIYAEAVEAMAALPPAQRFGVTVWGARDGDSWLRRGGEHNPLRPDRPLLFDDAARPKPAASAFAAALP